MDASTNPALNELRMTANHEQLKNDMGIPAKIVVAISMLVLSACASPGAVAQSDGEKREIDTSAAGDPVDNNDPIESVNRMFFEINNVIDGVVLEPTAKAYRFVTPKPARRSVRNFIDNIRSPITFANDLLQGEWNRAGTTVGRFAINSTVGVLGLFDVADGMGLPDHEEDFGQTLGVYGVGEGIYFVAPLLGPAPPRDLVGRGVDILFDPLTWVGGESADTAQLGIFVAKTISDREANIETFDEIERTSLDLYATVRSLYRQSRNAAIHNGNGADDDDDAFPELDSISKPQ